MVKTIMQEIAAEFDPATGTSSNRVSRQYQKWSNSRERSIEDIARKRLGTTGKSPPMSICAYSSSRKTTSPVANGGQRQ